MKALVLPRDFEAISGRSHLAFDLMITDNSGAVIASPDSKGGRIPRQVVQFDGVAVNLVNSVEAKVIAVAAGLGQTLVAADIVLLGIVQGV